MNNTILKPLCLFSVLLCYAVDAVWAEDEKETIKIVFIDEDGKPVDKVPCNIIPSQNGPPLSAVKESSDENGVILLDLERVGGRNRGFQFYTYRDHYVNIRCVIHEKYGLWPIPEHLEVVLEKGRTIGGTVLDPDGKPVEGAAIRIWFSEGEPKYREKFTLNATPGRPKTDAQGRWSCDKMPAEFRACSLNVTSDKHENMRIGLQPESNSTKRALEGKLEIRFARTKVQRTAFKGKIVDENGKPVVGARIYSEINSPGITTGGSRDVKSDENGVFELPNWPQEKVEAFFFIVADHLAPFWTKKGFFVDTTVERKGDETITFTLNKGVPIRFRFVDNEGKPAAGVKISPERYLPDYGYRNIDFGKTFESGDDGWVVWPNAPKEALRYRLEPSDRWLGETFMETEPDKEHKITVYPSVRVVGEVVDAETGQPIDGAEAAYSIHRRKERDGRETIEFLNHPTPCPKGTFELRVPYYQPKFAVRASAKGYKSEISKDFLPGEREVTLRIELKKDVGVAGTVLDAEDKPVEGAIVVLYGGTQDERFHIDQGKPVFRHPYIGSGSQFDPPNGKTDAEGRFTLPTSMAAKVKLFVLHDKGYAIAEPKETMGNIRLTPWCTVEGVLLKGKEPWKNQRLVLVLGDFDRIEKEIGFRLYSGGERGCETDENGRFRFDRVFPSEKAFLIRNFYDNLRPRWGTFRTVGGETTQLRYGYLGRPVVGKLKIKDEPNGPVEGWENTHVCLICVTDEEDKEKSAREHVFREHSMDSVFSYVDKVEKDGSFRLESVEDGEYRLCVRAYSEDEKRYRTVFRTNQGEMPSVDVVASYEAPTEEPLDLGDVTVELKKPEE